MPQRSSNVDLSKVMLLDYPRSWHIFVSMQVVNKTKTRF